MILYIFGLMHYIKIVCFNCRNSDNLHRELTVDMNEKLTLSELEEDVLLMAYKDAVILKLPQEFISVLRQEIHRRNLEVIADDND